MYLPAQFSSKDRAIALELMPANPLASLIANDDEGLPFVLHLPLHAELRGDGLLLLGHCAIHGDSSYPAREVENKNG